MRITITHGFFLPVPPTAGGAMEKMWWDLARVFAAAGHETTSISRRWRGWPHDGHRDGVRCLRLPGQSHTPRLWLNLIHDACWGLRVLRALPAADILVTNTVLLPALASRLTPSAGRVVVSLNRMPKGQLRTYARVARIQAPSSAVAQAVQQQAPALHSRLKIVPNTISHQRLSSARALNVPMAGQTQPRPLRLGYIGRLHPEKGLSLLVEAARRLAARTDLPPWQLDLRGPQDVARGGGGHAFVSTLRSIAPELFANNIINLEPPEFDPDALARAYATLDIFVYPSLAASGETFGVAVAEAMASGASCVVSDLPCFTDLITHERNGLVFGRGSSDPAAGLAHTLARLIADASLRAKYAAAARRDAERYDLSAVASSMLGDFQSLCATH